jgi:AAA domain
MRLGNMATLAREWAAVQRVHFSPFRDILLTCAPGAGGRAHAPLEVPTPLMKNLKATHNESQLAALTAGLDGRPFVLIQGPPGTGKTQCVVCMIVFVQGAPYRLLVPATFCVGAEHLSEYRCLCLTRTQMMQDHSWAALHIEELCAQGPERSGIALAFSCCRTDGQRRRSPSGGTNTTVAPCMPLVAGRPGQDLRAALAWPTAMSRRCARLWACRCQDVRGSASDVCCRRICCRRVRRTSCGQHPCRAQEVLFAARHF